MVQSLSTTVRIGYIRTVAHPNLDENQVFGLLSTYMRQTNLEALKNAFPSHRFIFSAFNISDTHVLDLLLSRIDKGAASIQGPANWYQRDPLGTWNGVYRSDLQLRISESCAATQRGQKVLQRCKHEGIDTLICGATDEQCDEAMLEESHYLVDTLTPLVLHGGYTIMCDVYDYNLFNPPTWFENHARAGRPQDNALTNPDYPKTDASRWRLARKQGQYSWRAMSGGSRGNGTWQCPQCGGRCKRNKKCTGIPRPEFSVEQKEAREQRLMEHAALPDWDDKRWAELTSYDLCTIFNARQWRCLEPLHSVVPVSLE